ncbi:alpha-L-fucosidase [Actinocatenispora sera]|uniref:alpha-L-fucosidase n=1 Tax=Actinocatenispora sera TaxID=390989 RepID=A0A810L6W4_9ACTN|nr:alpha-L-fucosidase [Actinocatenispora sera]BCJ31310.1 alpha-L-fucosidase [Actinocatenispora sera]
MGLPRRHLLTAAAGTGGALALGAAAPALAAPAGTGKTAAGGSEPAAPVPVPIAAKYDNNGIGTAPGDANIDGSGYGFPAGQLPSGSVTVDGVPYEFPATTAAGAPDNLVAAGQTIDLPPGRYLAAYLLATATYGPAGGDATVHYDDGSTSTAPLSAPDWYATSGQLATTDRYSPSGTDHHPVSIFPVSVWCDPNRTATGLTLPTTAQPAAGSASLHVFALSMQPVTAGRAVAVRAAASTTLWLGTGRSQVVAVTVANLGSEPVTAAHQLTVRVVADGVHTTAPARIARLLPGEQARVQVGIRSPGLPAGTKVDGTVEVTGQGVSAQRDVTLTAGIPRYRGTEASLSTHQAPDWYDDAKFGIFIHWGVYSVPAWAPVGKEYAEWYWAQMNNPDDPTYAHHAQTWGEDFAYDDFIPRFTAAAFDPVAWVRLFEQAGARYFVLTGKHHEGFALFDSHVSDRTAVRMGPRRDLVRELFDAARRHAPSLHTGVYYSLPEWYNPADPWRGHGPQNPYTGAAEPYTGDRGETDYLHQLQIPQLKELITRYRPDVLWGDIGTPATDPSVVALHFNQALESGRQVTVNNRMGLSTSDFSTPEYASSFALSTAKFEACRGIDPFSFGYNAATPDDAYATAEELVGQLVDVVSKNGNLLLDIGPRADGTIPEIMATRLREMGSWLDVNGEAVYGTTYWDKGAAEGDLRFTVAGDRAFYVSSLVRPGSQLVVHAPVPVTTGDRVHLLGYRPELSWHHRDDGALVVDVPSAAADAGRYVWTFRISWPG